MSLLLDHLTAVVAGTVLLGALAVLQFRSQDTNLEAAQHGRTAALAGELATTLERELENLRSRAETEAAFARFEGGLAFGPDEYRFRLRRGTLPDGTAYTRQVTFPTLADPTAGPGSEVHVVTYAVAPTGETARVDGRERPLLRATRAVFARGGPIRTTGAYDHLVDFDVTVFGAGGATIDDALEVGVLPMRIQVAFRQAPELAGPDDGATSTAHTRTVRIPGVESAAVAVDDGTPGGIPDLPGDDGYDPTSEPTPTPVDDGTGRPGDGSSGDTTGSGGATPRDDRPDCPGEMEWDDGRWVCDD